MSVITITAENFQTEVLESKIPVVIDFWAQWCGPCKMFAPIVDEVAEELEGKVKVGKVNVDDAPALAEKYSVMLIPTLILFKDGKDVAKSVNVKPKDEVIEWIAQN